MQGMHGCNNRHQAPGTCLLLRACRCNTSLHSQLLTIRCVTWLSQMVTHVPLPAAAAAAPAELLGFNMQYTMFQMQKFAQSRLHDKQTLICACRTLVLISSSSSRATGRELLDVCNSLMQLLGCINDLQDQGQRANVFCTPTRCRQATRVNTQCTWNLDSS